MRREESWTGRSFDTPLNPCGPATRPHSTPYSLPHTQNLSFNLAQELMDVMDAMPDGPALVVCSSGGRASAVKCLRQV